MERLLRYMIMSFQCSMTVNTQNKLCNVLLLCYTGLSPGAIAGIVVSVVIGDIFLIIGVVTLFM